ncbi:MAG: DUF6883 domain-containing protein [Terrimicrobiaceae bacterium]|jgi:hypothetical protein|nr:hypothetical protein [Terrimicrobiaceae bacterium]
MKLPTNTIIDPRKVTHYLLVPQATGDKSAYLAGAGYTMETAFRLVADLRTQVLPHEAAPVENTVHGQYYEIRVPLTGPNGRTLRICSIWMKEHLSGITKFITLVPDKTRK